VNDVPAFPLWSRASTPRTPRGRLCLRRQRSNRAYPDAVGRFPPCRRLMLTSFAAARPARGATRAVLRRRRREGFPQRLINRAGQVGRWMVRQEEYAHRPNLPALRPPTAVPTSSAHAALARAAVNRCTGSDRALQSLRRGRTPIRSQAAAGVLAPAGPIRKLRLQAVRIA